MNNRKLERILTLNTKDYLAHVIGTSNQYKYTVTDFNSLSIKLIPISTQLKENEKIQSINLIYVNRIIASISSPTIIREEDGGALIINISQSGKERTQRQSSRLEVSDQFKPFLVINDPVQIDRLLHFELMNISKHGLSLKTSLSNKHLTAGQTFKNVSLLLPIFGNVSLSIEIKRIVIKNNVLLIGVTFSDVNEQDIEKIAKFCLFGTNLDIKDSTLKQKMFAIKQNISTLKELGQGLKVETVNNDLDYAGALKIRFEAYKKASKLSDHITKYEDCADKFDQHSILLIAKIGKEIVGTVRMVFSEDGKQFPFEEFIEHKDIANDRASYYEVSKLAVDPYLQRSDIVVKLFKEVARLTILNSKTTLCFSTRILRPMYRKIGFAEISSEVSHPVLDNESLALMKIESDDFVFGNKMKTETWEKFSRSVVQNLEYGGMLPANTEETVSKRLNKRAS